MEKKEIKASDDLKNIQANLKGHEIIKFIAKTLPNQPGVYQMEDDEGNICLLYTSPSPRDQRGSRMPSSA